MGGVRGLYHGTTPALVFGLLENTIAFGVNEQLKRYLMKRQNIGELPLEQVAVCGAAGGMVHCMFSCPTEVVKCKLQVTNNPFRGPIHCMQLTLQTGQGAGGECKSFAQTCSAIYRAGGWRGFFPGWIPAMLRAFPANAALFVGFEGSRRALNTMFDG